MFRLSSRTKVVECWHAAHPLHIQYMCVHRSFHKQNLVCERFFFCFRYLSFITPLTFLWQFVIYAKTLTLCFTRQENEGLSRHFKLC